MKLTSNRKDNMCQRGTQRTVNLGDQREHVGNYPNYNYIILLNTSVLTSDVVEKYRRIQFT